MSEHNIHNVSFTDMRLHHMVAPNDDCPVKGFPTEVSRETLQQANYKLTLTTDITVDHEPAVLTRLERFDGVNNDLFGEHISTVIHADGTCLGYVDMNTIDADGVLPTIHRAQLVATNLLVHLAPDLLIKRDVLWTKPHSETILISNPKSGKKKRLEITGIKVKSRNLNDGLYHWVIVSPNEHVIAFERNIKWIKFPGKRGTEKWLHDKWLSKHQAHF